MIYIVIWFQVFLFKTNILYTIIWFQVTICVWLFFMDCQPVLYLEVRKLHSLYIYIMEFLLSSIRSYQIWPIDGTLTSITTVGVMAMKGYSTLPKAPEPESEPHYWMQF